MYAFVCIVYVHVPVSVCVCICMCVCWLPNVESRKRKRLDGWRGCLFIHYPAALVVSGGHGNTCPGPFSTGLFVAFFGPAKAFSSRLPCSLLSSIPSAFYSFSFGSCLGFHFCFSYEVLCCLSFSGSFLPFLSALVKTFYVRHKTR